MVSFHNASCQGKSQTRTLALCGVKGPEDIGKMLRCNTPAIVGYFYDREPTLHAAADCDLPWTIHGLQGVKQKIEQKLMDLIAIVFDRRQKRIRLKENFDQS